MPRPRQNRPPELACRSHARFDTIIGLRANAIVSLIGRGVFRYQGLSRRIFEALADVNVVMISFAASDVNISVLVAEADAERAVQSLHREFFYKSPADHIHGVLARIDAIHGELEEALSRWVALEEK